MQSTVTHGIYNPKDYKAGWGDAVRDIGKTVSSTVTALPGAQRMDAQIAADNNEAQIAKQSMETALGFYRKLVPNWSEDPTYMQFAKTMPKWENGSDLTSYAQNAVAWLDALSVKPHGKEAIEQTTVAFRQYMLKKAEEAKAQQQQPGAVPAVDAPAVGQSNSWDKINNPGAKF